MTKEEEHLIDLVKEYARVSCLMAEYATSKEEEDELLAERDAAGEAILAMCRSALNRSAPVFEWAGFYLDVEGNKWVEDPNGTHGWWSERPGGPDDDGDAFGPREKSPHDSRPHGAKADSTVVRYYRRVS